MRPADPRPDLDRGATTSALLVSSPGLMPDAMGMNIRLLCRMINALCDHTRASA
ncbi:hypothetical protein PZ739_00845 [Pseudomonas kermanshahensis]|uniref:hypothetical protein n=1 Tax=Pseudomonas kermanshahensis TaxID=2745482 RepID=UPI0023DCAB51|nr:hypothetical protein [Pseudomonas kermanshahensis]WEL55745.1 hypothetical protein PZ739_00845 [Pseudomonas kermanshahensis]